MLDRPVVGEDQIHRPAQPLGSLGSAVDDRLPRAIARRHDERSPGIAEQQCVKRSGRKHQAQERSPWRHGLREGRVGTPSHDRDGTLDRVEELALVGVEHSMLLRLREGGDHHGEGLAPAPLAAAQARHRHLAGGVAGELEPSHPEDRHGLSGQQAVAGEPKRLVPLSARLAIRGQRHQSRTTARAGDALGVEASVVDAGVLVRAARAQREVGHGRALTVPGKRACDGVARTTSGAVGEGVAEARRGGVADLVEAGLADRKVRDERGCRSARLRRHGRAPLGPEVERLAVDAQRSGPNAFERQAGQVRPLDAKPQLAERRSGAERLDPDTTLQIAYPPAQPERTRGAYDPGPEADPLHAAPELEGQACRSLRSGGGSRQADLLPHPSPPPSCVHARSGPACDAFVRRGLRPSTAVRQIGSWRLAPEATRPRWPGRSACGSLIGPRGTRASRPVGSCAKMMARRPLDLR
jgi:hypothetical protein